MSGQEAKSLVAGASIEIDAPFGYKIPVQYALDGSVTGQAGGLASHLGSPTDKGRWWISGDHLCHRWNIWFGSEQQCLRLSKDGRTIHWQNRDGNSGTARIVVPAPVQIAIREEPQPQPAPPPSKRLPAPEPVQEKPSAEVRVEQKSAVRDTGKPIVDRTAKAPKPPVPQPVPVTRKTAVSESKATRVGPPEFVVVNVQPDDVLNVRSGPSAETQIVGGLPPGSRGIAIVGACQYDWCPIRHKSASGWVHQSYIASDAAPLASPYSASLAE